MNNASKPVYLKLRDKIADSILDGKYAEGDMLPSVRAFAAERMADFKVPRKVIILDEIPKGATGKMQRIGLAEKLGLVEAAA